MRCTLRLGKACAFLLIFSFPFCDVALSTPMEPTPEPTYRDLRDGYVRDWYIFNDQITDGILAPGDLKIETFANWWTTVSAHTQHNYDDGPYGNAAFYYNGATQDMPSGPMNFASKTVASDNYWLPTETNEMHFYMSYSQFDNNDFATFSHGGGLTPDQETMLAERNMERNGWVLGWVTNAIEKVNGQYVYDPAPGAAVAMDVYVHEGGGNYMANFGADGIGISRSNPQVSMSNDISNLAKEVAGGNPANAQWQPPTYDQTFGSYHTNSTANVAYKAVLGLTDPQFDTVVGSMEVSEADAAALLPGDVIHGSRTPAIIEATLNDHNGVPYVYEDAFLERSNYVASTNDGGVIAGLSGWDDYNVQVNNWGDQQVIRIDIAKESLRAVEPGAHGDYIEKIVFYDFGHAGGSTQVAPREIVFDVDVNGNIYFDDGAGGITFFPENRIYIARVVIIPEPGTMVLLSIGGLCAMAARRRRHRTS